VVAGSGGADEAVQDERGDGDVKLLDRLRSQRAEALPDLTAEVPCRRGGPGSLNQHRVRHPACRAPARMRLWVQCDCGARGVWLLCAGHALEDVRDCSVRLVTDPTCGGRWAVLSMEPL
jgi:hypothetical protein